MYNQFRGFGGSAGSSSDVLNCTSDALCVYPVMYYVRGIHKFGNISFYFCTQKCAKAVTKPGFSGVRGEKSQWPPLTKITILNHHHLLDLHLFGST